MAKGGKRPGAGRPLGVKHKVNAETRGELEKYLPQAIAVILRCMKSENERVALEAATYLYDQARGKAKQAIAHEGLDTVIHEVKIEIV